MTSSTSKKSEEKEGEADGSLLEEIAKDCGAAPKVYEKIYSDPREKILEEFKERCDAANAKTGESFRRYDALIASFEKAYDSYSKESRRRIEKKRKEILRKRKKYQDRLESATHLYPMTDGERRDSVWKAVLEIKKKDEEEFSEFLEAEFYGDRKIKEHIRSYGLEGRADEGLDRLLERMYIRNLLVRNPLKHGQESVEDYLVQYAESKRGSRRRLSQEFKAHRQFARANLGIGILSVGLIPLYSIYCSAARLYKENKKEGESVARHRDYTLQWLCNNEGRD